jgi:hypothetical protein
LGTITNGASPVAAREKKKEEKKKKKKKTGPAAHAAAHTHTHTRGAKYTNIHQPPTHTKKPSKINIAQKERALCI